LNKRGKKKENSVKWARKKKKGGQEKRDGYNAKRKQTADSLCPINPSLADKGGEKKKTGHVPRGGKKEIGGGTKSPQIGKNQKKKRTAK